MGHWRICDSHRTCAPGGKRYGGIGRPACPPDAVIVGELMHLWHLSDCVGVSASHCIGRQIPNDAAYVLDWFAGCCQLSKEWTAGRPRCATCEPVTLVSMI